MPTNRISNEDNWTSVCEMDMVTQTTYTFRNLKLHCRSLLLQNHIVVKTCINKVSRAKVVNVDSPFAWFPSPLFTVANQNIFTKLKIWVVSFSFSIIGVLDVHLVKIVIECRFSFPAISILHLVPFPDGKFWWDKLMPLNVLHSSQFVLLHYRSAFL